jgi:hypothetical protein
MMARPALTIALLGVSLALPMVAGCFDFSSTANGGGPPGGPDSGGTSDSSGSDSGGTGEGSAADDGGGGSFCSMQTAPAMGQFFCDDFDTGQPQPFWTVDQSNGSISVDDLVFRSMPDSMAAKAGAVVAGGAAQRAVAKLAFPKYANSMVNIDVSFDMYVDQHDPATMPTPGKVTAFQLLYGPQDPNNFNQVAFNIVTTSTGVSAQVEENAPSPDGGDGYNLIGPYVVYPKVKNWTHVEIVIDILQPNGSGNSITVSLDGQANHSPLVVPLKGGQPRTELGIATGQVPAQPWTIRYDNFVAKLQ